jgi:hypothetical protein
MRTTSGREPSPGEGLARLGKVIFYLCCCWIYLSFPSNDSSRILNKWWSPVHLADACFSLRRHHLIRILTHSLPNGTPRVHLAGACFSLRRHHLVRILKESFPDGVSRIIQQQIQNSQQTTKRKKKHIAQPGQILLRVLYQMRYLKGIKELRA